MSCAAAALLLAACASYDTRLNSSATSYLGTDGSIISKERQASIAESKSYWDGDGISGSPLIVVEVQRQTASFYRDGKLVGVSAISSGRDGHDTPPGNYKIIEKKVDHRSNLYGDYVDAAGNPVVKGVAVKTDPMPPGTTFRGAPMPYWMRLTSSGVGLHQGFLPGVPDSRGCIRLPEKMARVYFENAPLGSPVRIVN
jgi:lipoprotein-anchoring transpeptidase ErfK/SrfK